MPPRRSRAQSNWRRGAPGRGDRGDGARDPDQNFSGAMIIGIMMFPMIIRTIILTLASATRISAMVLVTVGAPLADLRGTALGAGDIFVADHRPWAGRAR